MYHGQWCGLISNHILTELRGDNRHLTAVMRQVHNTLAMTSQRQTCLNSGLTRWSGGSGFGTRRPTAHLMQTVKAIQRRAAGAALADPAPRGFRGLGIQSPKA